MTQKHPSKLATYSPHHKNAQQNLITLCIGLLFTLPGYATKPSPADESHTKAIANQTRTQAGGKTLRLLNEAVKNFKIHDGKPILSFIGFSKTISRRIGSQTEIIPSNKFNGVAQPHDLANTPFESAVLTIPDLSEKNEKQPPSSLHIRIRTETTCITFKEADEIFGQHANREYTPYFAVDHPMDGTEKIGIVSYRPIPTPPGYSGSVAIIFAYQNCATNISYFHHSVKKLEN